jgi:uncharacterized protein (TIGR02145 family)
MKKTLTLLALAALAITVVSCKEKDKNIAVTGISLNSKTATLSIGDSLTLVAYVFPRDATNSNISWTSNDTTIAFVENGKVIALFVGWANVIVSTEDGNKTDTCRVTVLWPDVGQQCNRNNPGWGTSLGTVSFATEKEWEVDSQIWSDAVTATVCDKTTYAGGTPNNFNADCRSNPDYPGDLFSWCAIMRFAAIFCPTPWRIPTIQDFRELDIALGGTGNSQNHPSHLDKYLNVWGGTYSVGCDESGIMLEGHGVAAVYWSQTTTGQFADTWVINPSSGVGVGSMFRSSGRMLRCIRDNN